MKLQEQINYWIKAAEEDIPVMEHLLAAGDYLWCLFIPRYLYNVILLSIIGHLALEKALKALVIQTTHQEAPFIPMA